MKELTVADTQYRQLTEDGHTWWEWYDYMNRVWDEVGNEEPELLDRIAELEAESRKWEKKFREVVGKLSEVLAYILAEEETP